MEELAGLANAVGEGLKRRGHTVAVAESSSGGLISAALLAPQPPCFSETLFGNRSRS